jgi:hypothetical protein
VNRIERSRNLSVKAWFQQLRQDCLFCQFTERDATHSLGVRLKEDTRMKSLLANLKVAACIVSIALGVLPGSVHALKASAPAAFSFDVYGDSRSMMYLPHKADPPWMQSKPFFINDVPCPPTWRKQ